MADYILNYVFISAESVFSEGSQPGNGSILEHTGEMLVPVESGFPRSDTGMERRVDTVGVRGVLKSNQLNITYSSFSQNVDLNWRLWGTLTGSVTLK